MPVSPRTELARLRRKARDHAELDADEIRRYQLLCLDEETWRRQARALAAQLGYALQYHTFRSDRSDRGFPDEVWFRPTDGRILYFEFKRMDGDLTADQYDWLTQLWNAGHEAACWWPDERELLEWWLSHPHRVCQECLLDHLEDPTATARNCPFAPYPDDFASRNSWVARSEPIDEPEVVTTS